MLRECPELASFLERAELEPSAEWLAAMHEHVLGCETCQLQIGRCQVVARDLQQLDIENGAAGPHLSDLDIAHFAVNGLRAPNAVDITHHLSLCKRCRDEVARTVVAVREYLNTDLEAEPARSSNSFSEKLQMAFSSPQRALIAICAALAFVLECSTLALALALLVGAVAVGLENLRTTLGFWPFTEHVAPAYRLAVAELIMVVMGLAFRQIAAFLFGRATRGPVGRAPGDDRDAT